MTLILSCLTPKFIVQVSDRRLTWPDGRVADDSANKAIIFHDRVCFAYTGIAQIGAQRTDEWITDQLLHQTSLQQAIDHLKSALDATICKLRAPNRHLTVVIDLWGTQTPDVPERPWSIALSNYIDPVTRKYTEQPLPIFQQFNQTLPEGKGYAFLPLGQNLNMDIYRAMIRNLVRAMRHAGDLPTTLLPNTVGRFMQEAVLRVARSGNGAVGKSLMTTVLFNRQHEEYKGQSNTFSYLHKNLNDPIVYAPTVISPSGTVMGFMAYPGPLRPRTK